MNNKGSTLVLLVIIIALVIVLGTSVLNVVIKQYEIRRFNTDAKKSFYISETGLYEAYVNACDLINESVIEGLQMSEEYLSVNPLNHMEAKNIFVTNFKLNIKSNIKNRIDSTVNPYVEVRNNNSLVFINNSIAVLLRSSYIHENNVEKLTWVELVISVPEFNEVIDGMYNVTDYIELVNWSS